MRSARPSPLLAALLLAACGEREAPVPLPVSATLAEAFATESVVALGEDPSDSIAEIGRFVERSGGGYLIADRLLPRVRSYDDEGRLEASFGQFGEGPFEFQRITGLAESASGKVVVLSSRSNSLAYLTCQRKVEMSGGRAK